jgi:molybdenum cofactor biosynthesis enzyme MoaA
MASIPFLEMHVSHACNFRCQSCSHFSGNGNRGLVSLEEAETWMRGWQNRLLPKVFGLLGGEPTLNPQLSG